MGRPWYRRFQRTWDMVGLGVATGLAYVAARIANCEDDCYGGGIPIPNPVKLVTWIPRKIKQGKVNRTRSEIQGELAQLAKNNAAAGGER